MSDKQVDFTLENEAITEQVMAQYEALRQLGPCNMLDWGCVTNNGLKLGFEELADLGIDDYKYIIGNFGALMDYYGIDQSMAPYDILMAHGA